MPSPLEKLSEEINRIMDEREERQRIKSDPKAAGAELAEGLREFLNDYRTEKAAKAKTRRPATEKPEGGDNILDALFGG